MNGYLNNLTMRTLNAGNRVEPRLPALFEPAASGPPVVERTFEEEVTTVSEAVSSEALSDGSSPVKVEIEDDAVVNQSRPAKSDEEPVTRFEPVHHEEEREEPAESLTVQASVQPRTEAIEIATPLKIEDSVVEAAPIFEEVEEPLSFPLQLDDSAPRSLVPRSENLSHRTSRRSEEAQPAVVSPTPSPETDEFQSQITFERTTPQNAMDSLVAPIELESNEEFSDIELQVANNPEPAPEFEEPTFRRANPTPATWRDTRQQQWRRRQSPAPVESEPSINVTIGRIEVRAVPADSRKTTAPRRSESPVMPLEDYLRKQRRGGER